MRHPIDVALSLKRRNQNSYSLGLGLWERYYATVLDQVPVERRIITHYDTFFVDPEGEMARLCAFAGLEPATPRVRSDLRHHTTGIDLGDAGVSDRVRTLYAELCREAGAPVPRQAPRDEGRVRRLILDGAVAQRHADQRQAAIERLQEREQEFRAAHAKAEQAHRNRVPRPARGRSPPRGSSRSRARQWRPSPRCASPLPASRSAPAAQRPGLVTGMVGRVAGAAARRLPPSAQQSLRRGRRLAQRAAAEPGPTAKAVKQQALRGARAQATRLPPPAQQVLRRGRAAYRRVAAEPGPAAKVVVQRLPDPAQRLARHAWVAARPIRQAQRPPRL